MKIVTRESRFIDLGLARAFARPPAVLIALLLGVGLAAALWWLTSSEPRLGAGPDGATPSQELIEPGTVIGGPGTGPGRFNKPRAIDTDGTNLFVIDRSGRVQVIDPDSGRALAYWNLQGMSTGFPTGITIAASPLQDGTKAAWIADTHNHRVVVYALPEVKPGGPIGFMQPSEPALLLSFGELGSGPGQFTYPSDVAVLTQPDGRTVQRVYVSEFGGHDRVGIFDLTSAGSVGPRVTFVSSFGAEGPPTPGAVTFQRPQSMVFVDGRLLLSDSINHRLGLFELDGTLVRWFDQPGQFLHPRGITILPDRSALVVEFGRNRVQQIDTQTGAMLGAWGRPGRGTGELAEPWSLCLVGRTCFVADALNHRLVRMDAPASRWRASVP